MADREPHLRARPKSQKTRRPEDQINEETQTAADTTGTAADKTRKHHLLLMNQKTELLERAITDKILRAFYRVYDYLGFGFLESVYCNALAIEFTAEGMQFVREPRIAIYYKKGERIGRYKSDFLVEGRVVVEVKATEILSYANKRQLLNCLAASDPEVGLLLHFGPTAHFERFVHTNKLRV